MQIQQYTLNIETAHRGTFNVTADINRLVQQSGIQIGLCHIFIQHTSASLIITENADPRVREDIEYWMQKTIQDGDPAYRHNDEGDDDMSGHIRTLITQNFQTLPITQGQLNLGTWQGLFIYEHRTGRFNRKLVITLQGE